jgi:hypothetical protein
MPVTTSRLKYGMRETLEATAAAASELDDLVPSLSSLDFPLREPVEVKIGCGCR